MSIQDEITRISGQVIRQTDLIAAIKDALIGKGAGSGVIESRPYALSLVYNGSGYIDTGIDAANSNITIQARYSFDTMPTGYWYLIRAYVNESTNSTRILYSKDALTLCCLNSTPSSSLSRSQTRYTGVVYTDELKPASSTSFLYKTNGVSTTKARVSGEQITDRNILLFSNSASDTGVIAKIYYLKIYDGNTLVRDFIPYVSDDGEYGLYDNVTNQFFGNAGDGTFSADVVNINMRIRGKYES